MPAFMYATETEADSRETSIEIMEGCYRVAADGRADWLTHGRRIWEAPTDEERTAVLDIAWELADEDDGYLCWGPETYYRDDFSRCENDERGHEWQFVDDTTSECPRCRETKPIGWGW